MFDDQKVVTVFRSTQPLQIGMVRSALRHAGIPFSVVNDVVSSVMPYDGMLIVGFEVMERDAERAVDVIRSLGFDRKPASLPPRMPPAGASPDELARPRLRGAKLIEPQLTIEVRISPAEAMARLSAVGKETGLSSPSAHAAGVEDFFAQADGNEFRLYARRSLLALMVRVGARPPAFCTVRAESHGSGSLITARFSTPLLVNAAVVLFLTSSAAFLLLLAVAAVWPRGRQLGEPPATYLCAAASTLGLALAFIAKFCQNRFEVRARGFLEDLFRDATVSASEEG